MTHRISKMRVLKIRGRRVNLPLLTRGRSRSILLHKDFRDKAAATKAKARARVDHLQVTDLSGLTTSLGREYVTTAINLDT